MPALPSEEGGIFLSLIVPVWNEAETIAPLLRALSEVLAGCGVTYELLVVDDDSPDGTLEAARRAGCAHVRLIRRTGERGLATAVIRGWQAGRGEVLGTINADGQHPVDLLPAMIAAVRQADLVTATRFGDGGSFGGLGWHRRATALCARWLGQLAAPRVFGRNSDPLSGYYLFRRSGIAGVELSPEGYKTQIELLARGDFPRVAECGYHMRARQAGSSKLSAARAVDYLRHLVRLRRAGR